MNNKLIFYEKNNKGTLWTLRKEVKLSNEHGTNRRTLILNFDFNFDNIEFNTMIASCLSANEIFNLILALSLSLIEVIYADFPLFIVSRLSAAIGVRCYLS